LLGGVVLLALAAIIIPAMFDLSHDPGRTIKETNIPPRPEGMKVEVLPLPAPEPIVVPRADIEANLAAQRPHFAVVEGQSGSASKQRPLPTAADNKGDAVSPVKAAPVKPASPKPVPVKTPVSVQAEAAWVVQVGSFGNEANARALAAKIEKAGFPVRVFADAGRSGKTVSRVWAGPLESKEKAEVMRRGLLAKLKLKGLVLHRPNVFGNK